MSATFINLAIVMAIAGISPYIASLIPGRAIPEVVFLVFAGALLGPNMAGALTVSGDAVQFLAQLGMAFLFLNAGYQIDIDDLKGRSGGFAIGAWFVSFALAMLVTTTLVAQEFAGQAELAFAICLTTTAYGTLAPIMEDRNLTGTRVGKATTVYAAYGELLPVIALSLLLSARGAHTTLLAFFIFIAVILLIIVLPKLAPRTVKQLQTYLQKNAWGGSRPMLRVAIFLLVLMAMVASVLDLDVVLGAFVAGFLLDKFAPDNKVLKEKLSDIGDGFLTPIYFVVSGAQISLWAAASNAGLLLFFILLLIVIRGGVVALSLKFNPDTRDLPPQETYVVSAYCTMALPLIVAVTSTAVSSHIMSTTTASVLVCGGAITVLLIPIVTSFVRISTEAHSVEAVREYADARGEKSWESIWAPHRQHLRISERLFNQAVRQQRQCGHKLDSVEYIVKHDARLRENQEQPHSQGSEGIHIKKTNTR